MRKTNQEILLRLLEEYRQLGIGQQIDHDKFYLYSLITHSTAIEGSTVQEIENQLLFDEGISFSTIKRRLKAMSNKVIFVGSGYSGHWEIKE